MAFARENFRKIKKKNINDRIIVDSISSQSLSFSIIYEILDKLINITKIRLSVTNNNGKMLLTTNNVKLLGVVIDNKLNFSKHIQNICNTANNKVSQLFRMRRSMTLTQSRSLVNAFVLPYFIYCLLVWMFCHKKDINLINKVHKRALRAVHGDSSMSFMDLLLLENSVSVHTRHLQILMTETFKSLHSSNPQIMCELFELKDRPYNLRGQQILKIPPAKTTSYGINSLIFKASLL